MSLDPALLSSTRLSSTRASSPRSARLASAVCGFVLLGTSFLAPPPAAAEGREPGDGVAATRVALSDLERDVETGSAVVLENGSSATARVIFDRSSAASVTCHTDGGTTSRSRPGQYMLSPGAELACSARRGRHSFRVVTATRSGIDEVRSRLVVR